MLSHMYPSAVNRTAGIFVHEQVRALAALGHDVRVVSPKGWAPPLASRWRAYREVPGPTWWRACRCSTPGCSPCRARVSATATRTPCWAIARPLRRVRERWPFDVIHAHMLVPDGWAAAQMGAGLGVRSSPRRTAPTCSTCPARSPRSRARVAAAVEAIDQVCAVSAAIGDAAAALAHPRRPVRVVPNGADTRVFAPRTASEARARLGLPDDGPIVSYVGKLVPRKGVDTLVEAMGLLARRRAAERRCWWPPGSARSGRRSERRAAELGVGDRVRFVGKVAHDEVGWWMAAGDLVGPPLAERGPADGDLRGDERRPAGRGDRGRRHPRDRAGRPHRAARAAVRPGALAGALGRGARRARPRRRRWPRRRCGSGARSTPGRPTPAA